MAYLVFYRRGLELMRVSLDRSSTVVGRGAQADVVVPDDDVALAQLEIRREGDGYRLIDRSGKKTLVGGAAVDEVLLQDGIDIAVGRYRAAFLTYLDDEDAVSRAETVAESQRPAALPRDLVLRAQRVAGGEPVRVKLEGDALIGSGPDCTLRLDDPKISARHAKLSRQEDALLLHDLGSTNGVWLGATRLYEAQLPVGARVRLGDWQVWAESAKEEAARAVNFEGLVTADPGMLALFAQLTRIADSDAPVVILGESGTGKELLARAIHRRSKRAAMAYLPFNCSAVSPQLVEAELFGHEKGAYTGAEKARRGALAEADKGTLFLDEVGELALDLQPKLLRAAELGEIKVVGAPQPLRVDVRYISATKRVLSEEIREGRFREDLYYRLAVTLLHVPPLRRRQADVPLLWDHFIRLLTAKDVAPPSTTEQAKELLLNHPWPGNVRELRNVAQRALFSLPLGVNAIRPADIQFDPTPEATKITSRWVDPHGKTWAQIEAETLEILLRQWEGNRTKVAEQLEIAPSTVIRKIAEYGLGKVGRGE